MAIYLRNAPVHYLPISFMQSNVVSLICPTGVAITAVANGLDVSKSLDEPVCDPSIA